MTLTVARLFLSLARSIKHLTGSMEDVDLHLKLKMKRRRKMKKSSMEKLKKH